MATTDSAVQGVKPKRKPTLVVFAIILALSAIIVLAIIWSAIARA